MARQDNRLGPEDGSQRRAPGEDREERRRRVGERVQTVRWIENGAPLSVIAKFEAGQITKIEGRRAS
jgi:hypothetical protein